MTESASNILDFWFSAEIKALWYNSTAEFDQLLSERFLETYKAAVKGELEQWSDSPEGSLALVILLDQFPLNMFRGKKECFQSELESIRVANQAIESQFDVKLPDEQKAFLYLPFMHSETLKDQDRAIALFEKAGLGDNLKYARHHRNIIERFGRFPHRNKILDRNSTPEEISYLDSSEAFLG